MSVDHFFFVHSSVDGNFGCSKSWLGYIVLQCTIVNLFLLILVFSGDRARNGPTRSYGGSIFTFKPTSFLFSLLAVPS